MTTIPFPFSLSKGEFPAKSDSPLTLGHEFVGTVESVGSDVQQFTVGSKVAVNPNNGCNNCDLCHRGTYHYCEKGGLRSTIGIFRDGGWATHAIVPDSQVCDPNMRQVRKIFCFNVQEIR